MHASFVLGTSYTKDFRSSQPSIVLVLETCKSLKMSLWMLSGSIQWPFQSWHPSELISSPKCGFILENPADFTAWFTHLHACFCWHLLKCILSLIVLLVGGCGTESLVPKKLCITYRCAIFKYTLKWVFHVFYPQLQGMLCKYLKTYFQSLHLFYRQQVQQHGFHFFLMIFSISHLL